MTYWMKDTYPTKLHEYNYIHLMLIIVKTLCSYQVHITFGPFFFKISALPPATFARAIMFSCCIPA